MRQESNPCSPEPVFRGLLWREYNGDIVKVRQERERQDRAERARLRGAIADGSDRDRRYYTGGLAPTAEEQMRRATGDRPLAEELRREAATVAPALLDLLAPSIGQIVVTVIEATNARGEAARG